jgi:hypothetical protein
MSSAAIEQLKDLLGDKLCTPDQVKAPEGVATGLAELDHYLFWHGLPKGALTLLSGALGTGATSLWIEAAAQTVKAGKWVAWINNDIPLSPLPLSQKGVNLGHFVSIQPDVSAHGPADSSKTADVEKARASQLFFILQELLSSALFELVGCDLGTAQLKEHQLRKLQTQARDANIALVFISQNSNVARLASSQRRRAISYKGAAATVFSLIVHFGTKQITIERALHRQTPHTFPRSLSYARFTNFANFAAATSSLARGLDDQPKIEHSRSEPYSLLKTPRASV